MEYYENGGAASARLTWTRIGDEQPPLPGEVIVDEYAIVVQPDAPPGRSVVEVGLYDPATMQRLPVLDNIHGEPTQPVHTLYWGIKNAVEGGSYLGLLPLLLAALAVLAAGRQRTRDEGRTTEHATRSTQYAT